MLHVEDLIQDLCRRYGKIDWKRICEGEHIVAQKEKLPEGVNGMVLQEKGVWVVILNALATHAARRVFAFHELYHILRGAPGEVSRTHSQREEHEADLFAVLCTVPKVMDGDTVHTLADRTGLPLRLAKLRLEYELKKIAA